ncbi:hypothetical protein [Paenibacillus jilunlii]|uniref:hypothetical protein n=1 Tax=Paenibacillus jilunlii TaxID=682956 RepID=UPI00115F7F3F|nr:hypothetical protein [Paenibacillus jilunlii]
MQPDQGRPVCGGIYGAVTRGKSESAGGSINNGISAVVPAQISRRPSNNSISAVVSAQFTRQLSNNGISAVVPAQFTRRLSNNGISAVVEAQPVKKALPVQGAVLETSTLNRERF